MPLRRGADNRVVAYDLEKQPAEWVMRRSNQREALIWVAGGCFVALAGIMLVLAVGHRLSIGASAVLVAAALVVRPYADRFGELHLKLLGGAVAEREVGETLNALRSERWVVMHDIEQTGEGNIDHLVSGPHGVFLVETKAHRYLDGHLRKARRQAAKLHDELGVFVQPVICLHTRNGKAFKTKGVWVVPRQKIVEWLHSQHNQVVDFERLARFADGL